MIAQSHSRLLETLEIEANCTIEACVKQSLDRLLKSFENSERITPVILSGDADNNTTSILAATPHGKGADAYIDFSPRMAANTTHIIAGLEAVKRNGR